MSTRIENLTASMREVAFTIGPSELDLVEATFMNRGKSLLFGKPRVLAVALQVWAIFPVALDRLPKQYLLIGKDTSRGPTGGDFMIIAYDTQLRMGSMALLKHFHEGIELVKEVNVFKLPFETSSPFDGIVLTKLKEAGTTLTYDELRRRTRIKRGLPDILFNLERRNFLICTRENEVITHVALTD